MGWNAAALSQKAAGAFHLGADEGPHICSEGPQLLDARPARGDRLEGWTGQWPLAAEVEVRLVLQGRAVVAQHL